MTPEHRPGGTSAVAGQPLTRDAVRLLVVNSSSGARFRITSVLTAAAFDVICCATAAEALALLRVASHAALVVDHALTDMGGADFVAACRSAGFTAPAIMTAAEPRVPEAVSAFRAGASDFLPAPYDERLAAAVRQALERTPAPCRAAGAMPPV